MLSAHFWLACLNGLRTICYDHHSWFAAYHIYPKCSNSQAWANSADPDQMPQNVASDQGLHCLQEFLDTCTGCKIVMFRF